MDADALRSGERLFGEVGCAACHIPELRTGDHEIDVLSRVRVRLYSDMLLHDLGEELAGVCGPGAAPTEHRTARLWGLGRRSIYLHDGRARSLTDAIGFHGGEASAARARFRSLSEADTDLLLRFLEAL